MQFSELKLVPPLLRAVREAGYDTPSPIQQKAIPPLLAGRDLLGCAQTGTGKTAAFALPILQLLSASVPAAARAQRRIRALVLTPTRELALQIQESFAAYGRHTRLRSAVIFGGVSQNPQVEQLKRGVDILVATPGRLNDLTAQGYVKSDALEIFVLDEADRMLDMGFVQDVKRIIATLPRERQTLLFSATMPAEIEALAGSLLRSPVKVFVTPPATTVEMIEQSLYRVADKTGKRELLARLLQGGQVPGALVFTRTKHGADRVARDLARAGVGAAAIHGNKSQNARQESLARFKDGRVKVLVATDIAARGLDISELSHVINYDLPNIPETYVHRIGRTGRAGRAGIAISFCAPEEEEYLADIEKLTGFKVPEAGAAAKAAPPQVWAPREQAKAPGPGQAAGRPREPAEKQPPPRRPREQPASKLQKPQKPNAEEARPGAKNIVTKRPVWSAAAPLPPAPARTKSAADKTEGDNTMNRNVRRRGGKSRAAQEAPAPAPTHAGARAGEHGIFDFSEEELAEDRSLKLVSGSHPGGGDVKYASFEDYLKDH